MNYLTNTEIAEKYGVSNPTVMRWINAAVEGKNNLQVEEFKNKFRVIDNRHNDAEMLRLTKKGKAFKPSLSRKVVKLSPDFYDLFTQVEVSDIANDLEYRRMVNLKYCYFNGGAYFWDKFYLKSHTETLSEMDQIIINSLQDIIYYLGNCDINVIDIGPGNAYPLKHWMENLKYRLKKYIAIDISKDIIKISTSNVAKWLPGTQTKGYQVDIENNRLSSIFLENRSQKHNVANLIMFIGNTINNVDDRIQVLKNIRSGMVENDHLVMSVSLDTPEQRSSLNYVKIEESEKHEEWLLEMLGLDVDKCTIRTFFDDEKRMKTKVMELDKSYTIIFDLFGESREVELLVHENINRWKHYLVSIPQLINELSIAGLQLASIKLTRDSNYAIVTAKAKY
ncbi:MAG: hypothetical protein OHK0017_09190 [Patescibacteria group bacterium]